MTTRDHSLGPGWTPVGDVLLAAMEHGVLVAAIHNPDGIPEHAQILVDAHHGTWAISRSRCDLRGWVAVRIAPDGTDVTGTLCRLGAADATGSQVVETLLAADLPPG